MGETEVSRSADSQEFALFLFSHHFALYFALIFKTCDTSHSQRNHNPPQKFTPRNCFYLQKYQVKLCNTKLCIEVHIELPSSILILLVLNKQKEENEKRKQKHDYDINQ